MTRDEAIKAAHKRGFHSSADAWISLFVDLGLLKLEEPMSVEDLLLEALGKNNYKFLKRDDLRKSLDDAGLKIVEK